jgi:hypothetical protein
MPFPLAHPAAVLPLRRYCPRLLCFPALVLGSVTPDAGYLFGRLHVAEFSHTLLGSLGFCLPVGVLMAVVFYRLRTPLVEWLPHRYRELFRPLCQQPAPGLLAIGLSVLIGAWSHLLWDALTHNDGWFVERLPLLQAPVLHWRHREARVCHLVWYASSFIGVAWLYWTYEQWRQSPAGGARPGSPARRLCHALLLALLVFPLEALHHLLAHPLQAYAVGALTLAVVAGVLWRLDRAGRCG